MQFVSINKRCVPSRLHSSYLLRLLRLPFSLSPSLKGKAKEFQIPLSPSMASVSGTSITFRSFSCSLKQNQAPPMIASLRSVSLPISGKSFTSLKLQPGRSRFQVSCAAKPETVNKVCEIVKKQLALPEDSPVSGESKFAALGADSLDTVEIVMGLEEEFGISVEEESAQSIATVQDAADMIEDLMKNKSA